MTQEKNKKSIKIPEKFKDLVDRIEKMPVLDLAELVKILEEKFGVSAMPMVAAAPSASGGEAGGTGTAAEKTAFDIELTAAGDQKIAVIKLVREITGKGLKEAKEVVDKAPQIIKTGLKKEEAEELQKKLQAVGAGVELK